jgi:hypothetical protein
MAMKMCGGISKKGPCKRKVHEDSECCWQHATKEMTAAPAECCVCYEEISDTKQIQLGCNHIFCKGCLKKWFSTKATCPMCRMDHSEKKLDINFFRTKQEKRKIELLQKRFTNKYKCEVGDIFLAEEVDFLRQTNVMAGYILQPEKVIVKRYMVMKPQDQLRKYYMSEKGLFIPVYRNKCHNLDFYVVQPSYGHSEKAIDDLKKIAEIEFGIKLMDSRKLEDMLVMKVAHPDVLEWTR